jgi:hypothetical protein
MTHDIDNAFGGDPFAADASKGSSKSGGRSRTGTSSKSGQSRTKSSSNNTDDYGYEDHSQDSEEPEPEAPKEGRTRTARPRRRASIAGNVNRAPSEDSNASTASGATGISGTSGASGDPPRRAPRRGRRMSLVGSAAPSSSDLSVDTADYGYGEPQAPAGTDYGYGDAPTSAAPAPVPGARRRGRRMSVGGAPPPPTPAPAAEADYGYGQEASSYDDKFGGKPSSEAPKEEGAPRERRKMERARSGHLDIQDILATGGENPGIASSRQLGGAPHPTNNVAPPTMVLPDVQKARPRRRASLVGSLGGAAVGVVGAIGGTLGGGGGKLDDDVDRKDKKGRTRHSKSHEPEEVEVPGSNSRSERRRQGTMLERFA